MKISNIFLLKLIFTMNGNLSKVKGPRTVSFDDVEIEPFKNGCSAAVTISADFELAWAFRGRSEKDRLLYGLRTRENHPYLLDLFEKNSVPITWATVGHLFLKNCRRAIDGRAHPEMPRPQCNSRFSGDWYGHDPCTDTCTDPIWYASDLIDQIMQSKIPHEIGSHSFSHIDFSKESSNSELIKKEIEACVKVMATKKLVPRSLVFPHNNMGYAHLAELSRQGIIAVRHRDRNIRLSYPQRTIDGVYKLYESMNTRSARHYDYFDKAKLLIDAAKKKRSAFHLWFHPSDPITVFNNEFRRIIEYIALEQKKGSVWIATMAQLAAYCEARETTKLKVLRTDNAISLTVSSKLDRNKYPCDSLTYLINDCHLPVKVRYYAAEKMGELSAHGIVSKNRSAIMINVPTDAQFVSIAKE